MYYLINSTVISIFFIFLIHISLFNFNLKYYFIKSDNSLRWSDKKAFLIGGFIFIVFFIYNYLISYFGFNNSLLNIYDLFFLIIFYLIGLYDDKYNINGKIKILFYFIYIFFICSFYVNYLDLFSLIVLSFVLFGIFISLNIIDNMDGVFPLFFLYVLIFISSLLSINNNIIIIYSLFPVILVSLYFLIINLFYGKNYLGDSGSYLLSGLMIITFLKYGDKFITSFEIIQYVSLLIICFAYSIYDIIYVCIKRIQAGKSPLDGGLDHSSHKLSRIFNSDLKAIFFLGFINLIYFLINFYLILFNFFYLYNIFIMCLYFAILTIIMIKPSSK